MPSTTENYRHLFAGLDTPVPLYDGTRQPYINLDNAASTPALSSVQAAVNAFLPFYSSVHRGTGFKSQLSTHAYEAARQTVLRFVNADPNEHTCIFGKNTTEAINKLAHRFPFTDERDVVLTSGMEHHSNDLPWRSSARTVHVGLTGDGRLDETDFDRQLADYAERVALVAITGASNVTGYLNPIHRLARKAHAVGAQILVDCAQLAPHRRVDMRTLDDPEHLDFIAISAHKMYAPFGTGALVGRRELFARGDPDMQGGGTVEIVTLEDVVWAGPPDRDEAGSPNTVGAVAQAAAIAQLESIGMETVAAHEAELTAYALRRLQAIPDIHIYGDQDPQNATQRLGVIPLQVSGISHFKAAAILGNEFGIGVRSGCFCAHPYILHLLGLSPQESRQVRRRMLAGDKSEMPGLIRASFGLYNTLEEVDALAEALERIVRGEYKGHYQQEITSGEYHLLGWEPPFEQYFSWESLVLPALPGRG
jgi:selenocysteine lyase/cysteine desulfurase